MQLGMFSSVDDWISVGEIESSITIHLQIYNLFFFKNL
jgi:hypothetical protein